MSPRAVCAAVPSSLQVQGTCVALDGVGVLLRGPSGAGKSDLALRLIDGGAVLVADDLCQIRRESESLFIDLPDQVDPIFRGQIEIRGFGIARLDYFGPAPLGLVVDLRPVRQAGRSSGPAAIEYLGLARPLVVLDPFQASAATRLRLMAASRLDQDRIGSLRTDP
jgi:HPr kinase/phosphorylase